MAGFDYEAGRSNNMVAAEERGMVTIGRWARRYKVSAAAARAIMRPHEAHHTGTGRRGKSRLTYVIAGDCEPTAEQLAAMRDFDAAAKAAKEEQPVTTHTGCVVRYLTWPTTRYARRIPTEVIERNHTIELFADGTPHWKRLSGLVVAKDGLVIFSDNLNPQYDNAAEIARRICGGGGNG